MYTRDLEWLVVLSDTGHLTDAAAILGTTQPTLSRVLARVESELGTRLFERLPGGVVANPDGEIVVEAARQMTRRYDELRVELAARSDPDGGIVRLAFLDSMATSLVPRLLRGFHAQVPQARLSLRQEAAHEIRRDLDTGVAELAITWPRPEGPFEWVALQEERLALVVPPTHRWRDRRRIALSELAGEDLVTTPRGYGFRVLVEDLLNEAGVTPTVSFESADLATIEGLVAAGLGVAVLPEQLAGASGTVGIPLHAAGARRVVGLAWRSDRDLSPAAMRFRDHIVRRND
ncbi:MULTISPECIES: LysR family transcriptional regulator [unclassified Nocardioides]|uniref:LysR family transcriptional regulator n=1 Tax=unclassified Nocardioides TaxID=2615069 RepID=UPI0006F8F9A7|nr:MULTISPECIES: LysR family transcriptional regulator [unclassified Nocardioides]KRA31503.1 LysR family transcriptional regulator [Nocardioides sp. Root614]KRA88418.1 LysR family transcriptional regulator [Nocardioides sp. Root682]